MLGRHFNRGGVAAEAEVGRLTAFAWPRIAGNDVQRLDSVSLLGVAAGLDLQPAVFVLLVGSVVVGFLALELHQLADFLERHVAGDLADGFNEIMHIARSGQ